MDPTAALNGTELLLLGSLIAVFAADLLAFAARRDPLAIYQPPVFVILFLSYYCVVGPLQRVASNDWFHVSMNFRFAAAYGWAGALVFYLSLRLGYGLFSSWRPARRFAPPFDNRLARALGMKLCWLGFISFSLVNGLRVIALLNPTDVLGSRFFQLTGFDLGPFTNYATTAFNLLIPGILLQFTAWVRSRQQALPWMLWTFVALSTFISLGFRWRIVTLLVPMVLLWYLARGKAPSIRVLAPTAALLLLLSGFIEQTRSYGAGLSLEQAADLGVGELFSIGFNESSVFLITGGLIANSPVGYPFVGFQPLISALLFPIPRAIWDQKNSFDYLSNALAALFNSDVFATGQAALNYAEYYLMFGWPSVVLMGLLCGWLLRCLWNWFTLRRHETLAQVAYVTTCGLLYMWISRGYLPQVLVTFVFGSLPLFWLYYRYARPQLPASPPLHARLPLAD